jgi:hypothetical protein
LDTLSVSQQATVDEHTREGSDASLVSLVTLSTDEVAPPSLGKDSAAGGEQDEIAGIDTICASAQISVDDDGNGVEEERKEDFESKSLHLVMKGVKQEQPLSVMTSWSPKVLDDKGPTEVSGPEQIVSVSRSANEATPKSLPRDCPSLASTAISLDSSIPSDGEMTNYRGGSSMSSGGGSGISPQGSERSVTFCPSSPQVREYEPYPYMDGLEPSSATSDDTVQFNNLNKKLRMLKKSLDELNGDGEALKPDHGTQTVTRVVKQLGQAFLIVSASILNQRH